MTAGSDKKEEILQQVTRNKIEIFLVCLQTKLDFCEACGSWINF